VKLMELAKADTITPTINKRWTPLIAYVDCGVHTSSSISSSGHFVATFAECSMTCNDSGSGAQAALLWDCDDDSSFDENIQFSNHGNNSALHQAIR
jgi:hypothetical protein